MKKTFLLSGLVLLSTIVFGQLDKGKIVFERTMQLQIRIADDNPAFQNMIPKERKDRFELLFAGGKSLWLPAEDENPNEDMNFSDGGGARIVMRMPGSEDISYHNMDESKKVEQRELGGKTYIVADSIRKMNWKLAGETKTILGYNCMKATSQQTQQNMRMNMDNGKTTREAVTDTLNIVAWFTNEIPGSFGPDSYQGQLPGTILEIDVNNGRTNFKAITVSEKTDVAKIKEPTKGKKMTPDEFNKEREQLYKDMQQNGGGNMRVNIRN